MSRRGAPTRTSTSRPRRGGVRTRSRRALAGTAAGAAVAVLVVAGIIGSGGVASERSASETKATSAGGGRSAADITTDAGAPPTTMATAASEALTYGADPAGDGAVAASDTASGAGSAPAPDTGTGTGNRLEPKIVRTGSLELVVARGSFDRAAARLTTLATGAGGFVSASQTSALDDHPQGTITLRVPVDRFDSVIAQVRKLGTVEALTTGSQDVTGEYSDVAARIRALQAEREQINLVLGRAETIPDILSVRDRLAAVQGELEQLQGRQQVLDDQTSLSTLAVSLREKGQPTADTAPPAERSGFDKLWHDAGDRFTDGLRAIALGLATLAPWLLLALVLFLPARALWRRWAPLPDDQDHPTPSAGPPVPDLASA